jgi:hypothetical protein
MGVKTLYVFRSRIGKTFVGIKAYEGLIYLAEAFKVPHEFPWHWTVRKKIKELYVRLKAFNPGDLVEIKSRNPWRVRIMHELGIVKRRGHRRPQ